MNNNVARSGSMITSRARFFWFLGGAFALYGLVSWFVVAKEEDPRLKPRFGTISVIYPGASPSEMNQFVVREIENELTAVTGIDHLDVLVRSEFAFFRIELKGSVASDAAITREWDDVDAALRRAEAHFPQGVIKPELNRKAMDQEAIIIAITGSESARHRAMVDLEKEVYKLRDVAAVTNIGDPGRQVTVALRRERLAASGLNAAQVLGQIQLANQRLGGGSLDEKGQKINLKPVNGLDSVAELKSLYLAVPRGGSIPLAQIANVSEAPVTPVTEEMRWQGQPASGLGVVPRADIDLVKFGRAVSTTVIAFAQKNAGDAKIEIINSQPDFVSARLRELAISLVESMLILGAMMVLTMGTRVGLLVAVMLPVISLIALALNTIAGGVLHQISIAAFVMSLGMLIDNVIVVTESVQEQIDRGISAKEAASHTVSQFSVPLLSSTLTTIASFLPMLLAKGTTAEFTFAIPAIAITTLSVSWVAAVFLTPALAAWGLKPGGVREWKFLPSLSNWVAETALRKTRRLWLGIAGLLVVATLSAITIGQKFFPSADRDQLVVEILYPEGVAFSKTRAAVAELEARLSADDKVLAHAAFVGRSTPRFYNNLNQSPNAPHLAQVLVMTKGVKYHKQLMRTISALVLPDNPRIIVRSLEQGPPVPAPVEIRLIGEGNLMPYAESMAAAISNARHDAEGSEASIELRPRDASLADQGFSRYDVAVATLLTSRGIGAGFFRTRDETWPIVIGYPEAEKSTMKDLKRSLVGQTSDRAVYAADTTAIVKRTGIGVLHRRDRENVIRVLAEVGPGESAGKILGTAKSYLATHALPDGVRFEVGGEAGESLKANGAIMAAMPLAMIILIAILIWEFNSIKLTGIIMTSVPTAALGIMPGLALGGQSMGFMAMLALFALIGIVVNNGILLIDRFKSAEADGENRQNAVRIGIRERLRPILLTSGSTVLGMVPLAFTDSTLWPPFAWAMMSGLAVSTLFTLFIVPWLYAKLPEKKLGISKLAAVALMSFFVAPALPAADAAPVISVQEVLESAAKAPQAKAAWHRAAAARHGKTGELLAVWGPRVTAGAEYIARDREFFLGTPLGSFPYGRQNYGQAGIELYQTLWSSDGALARIPAADRREKAAALMADWETMSARYFAVSRFYDCSELKQRQTILSERVVNLRSLATELARLVRAGRGREIDLAKVRMSLAEATQAEQNLGNARALCEDDLGRLTASPGARTADAGSETTTTLPAVGDTSERPDLKSLAMLVESLAIERDGVLLESLPEIYAKGNYNYFGARQFTPEDWFQASVGARFRLLDGGTQIARRQAKSATHDEKQVELGDARRAAQNALVDSHNRLITAEAQVVLIQGELEAAQLALSREKGRVAQGRVPATGLLEVYDTYHRRREALVMTRAAFGRLYYQTLYLQGKL